MSKVEIKLSGPLRPLVSQHHLAIYQNDTSPPDLDSRQSTAFNLVDRFTNEANKTIAAHLNQFVSIGSIEKRFNTLRLEIESLLDGELYGGERKDLLSALDIFIETCIRAWDTMQGNPPECAGVRTFADIVEFLSVYHSRENNYDLLEITEVVEQLRDIDAQIGSKGGLKEQEIDCLKVIIFLEVCFEPVTKIKFQQPSHKVIELYAALDADVEDDIVLDSFLAQFQDKTIMEHDGQNSFFVRGISFLNSSGCGKSRLMRNIGRIIPSFAITLQSPHRPGISVPLPDKEVCQYLQENSWRPFEQENEGLLGHVVAAAFLSALYHQLYVWVALGVQQKKDREAGAAHDASDITVAGLYYQSSFRHDAFYQVAGIGEMEKAESIIAGHKAALSLRSDICPWLYSLRPQAWDLRRPYFLRGVVGLATAILQKNPKFCGLTTVVDGRDASNDCSKYTADYDDNTERRTSTDYLEDTDLITNLNRFFRLLDGCDDAKDYSLTTLAATPNKHPQFIFGIDECRYLRNLVLVPDNADRARMVEEAYDPSEPRPQGLSSFLRVFRDLEFHAESAEEDASSPSENFFSDGAEYCSSQGDSRSRPLSGTIVVTSPNGSRRNISSWSLRKSLSYTSLGTRSVSRPGTSSGSSQQKEAYIKGPKEASRRVWIALLDTISQTEILSPGGKAELAQASCRAIHEFKGLTTPWVEFGMDHALRKKLAHNIRYVEDMTMQQIHSFKHLKTMGRGIWNAHEQDSTLMTFALYKLFFSLDGWEHWPLYSDLRPDPDLNIDIRSFAVASLRFGLDSGLLCRSSGNAYELITDSMAKHMRVLIAIIGDQAIETATPAEPILALAALVALNYGESLFDAWTRYDRNGIKQVMPLNNVRASKSKVSWKKLLLVLSVAFQNDPDLINVGDAGELIARIILTLARDGTLPPHWEEKTKACPTTTLRLFVESLIGKADTKTFFRKNCPMKFMEEAIINFIQFVPLWSPAGDKNMKAETTDPLDHGKLKDGFIHLTAFIALAGQKGYNLIIPIAIPMSEGSHVDCLGRLVGEFYFSYIAISVKFRSKAQGPLDELWSSQVVGANGEFDVPSAAMVILMDLGTNTKFLEGNSNYISDHVAGDLSYIPIKQDYTIKKPTEDVEVKRVSAVKSNARGTESKNSTEQPNEDVEIRHLSTANSTLKSSAKDKESKKSKKAIEKGKQKSVVSMELDKEDRQTKNAKKNKDDNSESSPKGKKRSRDEMLETVDEDDGIDSEPTMKTAQPPQSALFPCMNLRIRGMHGAYIQLDGIDKKGNFANACKCTMVARHEIYDATDVGRTLPNYFPLQAHYRLESLRKEHEKIEKEGPPVPQLSDLLAAWKM